MGSISNFLEDEIADHVFNVVYTPPATIYVALATADPTDAGTGAAMSEVANANGYARTAMTFGAAASRKVVQSGAVTFPQASGTWGTITHWAIVDSATHGAGNMLAHGAFTASFAPVSGNTPTIPTTEIEVEFIRTHYTAATISAASGDNSINDSANNFPLFNAGATIYISGFTGTAGNNGTATVTSSTISKIVISGITLVTDAAGESVRVALSGGFTDYTVHKWLDLAFRNQTFTKPPTYIGLATAVIEDADVAVGDITECTGGSYARKLVNINGGASPTWDLSSGGALDNTHAITFVTPTGSWGLVTSAFIIDSASGAGNVLGYDNEGIVNQTPLADDVVQFAVGAFDVSIQ